ncbi:hypothetical protein, partial [Bifidobacterium jacchi]|uniref:hypothetical protein n=1 Tax=Bifidobacterium jacchi TaxID=2490545 RepID=UPI0019D67ADC
GSPVGSHSTYKQLRCLLHGAGPAIMDALRAHPAGSPVGSHSTYKQLRCLLHGAGPAIMVALRAQTAGSPVGSHSTYKQLRCLLHGAVLTRGANNMINELLTRHTRTAAPKKPGHLPMSSIMFEMNR